MARKDRNGREVVSEVPHPCRRLGKRCVFGRAIVFWPLLEGSACPVIGDGTRRAGPHLHIGNEVACQAEDRCGDRGGFKRGAGMWVW